MESASLAQQMAELGSLMTSALMPFIIIIALLFAFWFAMRYERNHRRAQELEYHRIDNSRTNITMASEQPTPGGYEFITIDDEFKPVFLDVMNGFADYAKMKGYEVEISIDNSHSGKVGLRVAILDRGVTVSTNTVRNDVQDYIRRFQNNADFSDMPMAQNSAEHSYLVNALSARFSHMKTQIELHQITEKHLKFLLEEVRNNKFSSIGYQPVNNHIHFITSQEANNLRDNYTANNSQNVAQGKGASATTIGSTIQIGNTYRERAERIEALKNFIIDTEAANIPVATKSDVVRYLTNAREEMENEERPDADAVGKALEKANNALSALDSGAGLIEKLAPVLALFGLS